MDGDDIGADPAGRKKVAGPMKEIETATAEFARKEGVLIEQARCPGFLGQSPHDRFQVGRPQAVIADVFPGAVNREPVLRGRLHERFEKRVDVLPHTALGGPDLEGVDSNSHRERGIEGTMVFAKRKEPVPVVLTIRSPAESEQAARAFAPLLRGGDYVSLIGDLGAGKTFFVRALARALGVTDHVASPTFVLQRVYSTGPEASVRRLLHYDLYRLHDPEELGDIGFDECPADTAVLAEWGDRFPEAFPEGTIRITLEHTGEESRRMTVLFPDGERAERFRTSPLLASTEEEG